MRALNLLFQWFNQLLNNFTTSCWDHSCLLNNIKSLALDEFCVWMLYALKDYVVFSEKNEPTSMVV